MSGRGTDVFPILEDGMAWPEDAVEVGRVIDAWGVKGGIKVQPFSSDPQALFCTKKWFLRPAEQAPAALARPSARATGGSADAAGAPPRLSAPSFLKVKQAREQGEHVVATAEGLDDRNAAEALKGARVFVSRSAFPTPDEDEFYWVDLIGLDVVNREGQSLGKVVDLIDTGPHCILRCAQPQADAPLPSDAPAGKRRSDGNKATETAERLIPFVSAYIVSVDVAEGRIVADWGLDY